MPPTMPGMLGFCPFRETWAKCALRDQTQKAWCNSPPDRYGVRCYVSCETYKYRELSRDLAQDIISDPQPICRNRKPNVENITHAPIITMKPAPAQVSLPRACLSPNSTELLSSDGTACCRVVHPRQRRIDQFPRLSTFATAMVLSYDALRTWFQFEMP
jgi:hypothetical protein